MSHKETVSKARLLVDEAKTILLDLEPLDETRAAEGRLHQTRNAVLNAQHMLSFYSEWVGLEEHVNKEH